MKILGGCMIAAPLVAILGVGLYLAPKETLVAFGIFVVASAWILTAIFLVNR